MMYILERDDIRHIFQGIQEGCAYYYGPYYLEIHITDRCNSNCYFCNQQWLKGDSKELNSTEFTFLINRLAREGLRAIRFSGGGEPTLHPHINEILDVVYESKLTIPRFDTNAILLTPDISQRLVICGLKTLHISMQAPTPQSWSQVTKRRPSDFCIILENIRKFIEIDKERRTYVYASFVVDEPTFDKMDSMIRLCEELNIQYSIHDLNSYSYSDHFLTVCLPVMQNRMADLVTWKNKNRFQLNNLPRMRSFVKLPRSASEQPSVNRKLACIAPWVGMLIRASGNVYLCCALPEDKHILGNIFEQDLMDIWRGDLFENVRREAKNLFFRAIYDGRMRRSLNDCQYLSKHYCIDYCPVKRGMFSSSTLEAMFRKISSLEVC